MLRENKRLFSSVLLGADTLAIGGASLYFLWGNSRTLGDAGLLVGLIAMAIWPFLSWHWQVYHSRRLNNHYSELWLLVKVAFLTFGLATLSTVILINNAPIDGMGLLAACLSSSLGLFLFRSPVRMLLRRLRKKGRNARTMVLLGQGDEAQGILAYMESNQQFGLDVLGYFSFTGHDNPPLGNTECLGSVCKLGKFLDDNVVDEVVIAPGPKVTLGQVNKSIQVAQELGVVTRLLPQTFSPPKSRVASTWFGDIPTLAWFNGPSECISVYLKRAIDLLGASVAVLFASPILLTTALMVKLTSKGPVFFAQTRCGLNGRTFKALKFRTMVPDAEKKKKDLLALNEEDGPAFKIKRDPRITAIGHWLRKFSIDELPQLFNVLSGEMSLVGPRPPIPEEVSQYDRWQRRRLSMPPGITCIWQVKGRNAVSFNKWMEMDIEYIDNWSLALDIKLLAMTIPAVLKGTGA